LTPKGESGSGKSEQINHILKLIPPREWKEFTYITEKALLHTKENLSHRILCVFERQGGEKANYQIRTAQSEEKLSIFIPVKDSTTGDFQSIEKSIPAEGMVYIETTTEEHIEPQNANRTFEFFTDTSPEQTREVLRAQARTHILNENRLEQEYRVWRCAQDLLEPLQVYIPFARELAEQFPADRVRARRDYPRLLALIETLAFLHQKYRERKEIEGETFIVASDRDFEMAYDIIRPILSQTYKDLSLKEETLIRIIKQEYGMGCFADPNNHVEEDANAFSPKELWDKTKKLYMEQGDKDARDFMAYSTLRLYVRKLTDKSILEWNGGLGIRSKYALIGDIPQVFLHISLSSLANTPSNDEKTKEYREIKEQTLAKDELSQSVANQPISKGLANDQPISQTLAKDDFSSSSAHKSLDILGISSLAKQNIKGKAEETSPDTRYIRKSVSRDGETIYQVTEFHKNGGHSDYLVYPRDDDYSLIEQEFLKSNSPGK